MAAMQESSSMLSCYDKGNMSLVPIIGAVALPSGFFPGRLDTHLTDVRCNGSEYDLLSCLTTMSGQCTSNEDAAVVCQGELVSLKLCFC